MEMNRRSFFGATAAAVLSGPAVAAEAVKPVAGNLASLAMSIDTKPLSEALTGYSAVLRSISGVHKERMEKRLAP